MRVRSPINEGVVAEKLNAYIKQKVESLDDYKWIGKTYAYKKMNLKYSSYIIRNEIRWEVDNTVRRPDVIDLTFSIEISINQMLLPIWSITFQGIEGINGIDSAFNQINDEVEEFKKELEF
ncbi:MAG: hypothetical protein ACOCRO_05410 [Halanaerobiales bacterium]